MILFITLNKYLAVVVYQMFPIEYFICILNVIADYLLKLVHVSVECYQESSEKRSILLEKQLIDKDSISRIVFFSLKFKEVLRV